MTHDAGHVLVVDDDALNRRLLIRALEVEGHEALAAESGVIALQMLGRSGADIDVVLLDIVMPELDGYETLSRIKADPSLQHVPVIVISAVDELDSVVRCIGLGATDYLTKPFERSILAARVSASLASKRLRDLELEYLEQVGKVTEAAVAVESDAFDDRSLAGVAQRSDALGQLARTFQRMAGEVRAREDALRREVRELRIEIDEARQARKVAEITDTDYFRDLRSRAAHLRGLVEHDGE